MTTEEQIYFEALTRKHARAADVLSESFLSGIWDGLVDKYTEPAHFVYELLQNADDAGASYGRIEKLHG